MSTCRRCIFCISPVGVEGLNRVTCWSWTFSISARSKGKPLGFQWFLFQKNGGVSLTEHFPEAQKSIWDFIGMFTSSRHVPGVEFAGLIHPGLIGCLPSKAMLREWNTGKALYDTEPDRVPALATLPYADTAHMGRMKAIRPRLLQQRVPYP